MKYIIISLCCLLLAGCIPTPEVTVDFYLPDLIEDCTVDTELSEAQCMYLMCKEAIEVVEEGIEDDV